MLEAKFYINPKSRFSRYPIFLIFERRGKHKYWMLSELVRCDPKYIINEVIPNLDKVTPRLKCYPAILSFNGEAFLKYIEKINKNLWQNSWQYRGN